MFLFAKHSFNNSLGQQQMNLVGGFKDFLILGLTWGNHPI